MKLSRPVWAEINLDNLAHNMREVRRITNKKSKVTAVIKADGYGHGALAIAQTLLDNGADRFAVATLSEAIQLRSVFKDIEILILGYTPADHAKDVIENNIIQTIYSLKQANEFARLAVSLNKTCTVHIKLDTGMNRLGMQICEETVSSIIQMSKLDGLYLEGIFTHFAVSDELDKTYTIEQVEKFNKIVDALKSRGVEIPIKHTSNSAAIIDLPEFNFDMVRAGIMLYGLYPSDIQSDVVNLKEVMCLKAKISQVKEIESGTGVSYGLKYKCSRKSKIATLPIGYADGYTRMLTGKSYVMVKGVKVPTIGNICMDQCIIDVTGLDVQMGDEVILYGGNDVNGISINSIAKSLTTINYEIVCMLNKRVPRLYLKDDKKVEYKDYILMLSDKKASFKN